MKHTWTTFASGIALVGAALSDCSGGQTMHDVAGCAIGGVVFDNVVQPMPNALSVPTAPGTLILEETLPVAAQVSLVPAAGGSPLPLGVLPTAMPGATASPGPPPLASLAYPQLERATTYQVAYKAISQAECPPELYGDGTFTTQE